MTMNQMKGKRVLVTGSGTGVGKGIALGFARAGANVAFHYSHSKEGAFKAVEQARQYGVMAEAFEANLASVDQIKKLTNNAIEFLGGIDVIINNAGISMNLPFEKVTVEQYDLLYDVNVRAMFFIIQECLPSMKNIGGGVVI